ncbi:MAG: PAS domain S-box protein [Ignavibacteriales bacterium]|nr:PAS domain S-box protein [Ignavibacteriales bacterium]
METPIHVGMILNTALLVSLGLIYDLFRRSEWIKSRVVRQVLIGLSTAAIGFLVMSLPWEQQEGVFFDTRSILISISGLFFGVVHTIIGIISMLTHRILSGGAGVWMGTTVIVVCGVIGLLWRQFRLKRLERISLWEVYLFGLVVHLAMFLCTFILHTGLREQTQAGIAVPMFVIYPIGTVLLGWLLIAGDERRNMLQKIIDSERNFRGLFNTVSEGIIIQNMNLEFVEVNPGAEKMFGYSRDELIGKTPDFLGVKGWNKETSQQDWFEKILRGEDVELEFPGKKKNGEVFTDYVKLYKGRYNNEDVLIGLNVDISEFKKTQQTLLEAKEKAEEANRLKSNFLANMSHELRTPMIGILGYAELLRERKDNEELRKTGEVIYKSADRLLKTLTLILNISKMETDFKGIQLVETNVDTLLFHIAEEFKEQAEKKGVKLEYKPNETLTGYTEPMLLEQIIANLVDNAVKFTSHGKVTIFGDLEENENEERRLKITVKDTGIGIAPDHLELIFDEFRQASEGWERSFEGPGLGLSVSKKFVEKMGGSISVKSKIGEGSEFSVQILFKKG